MAVPGVLTEYIAKNYKRLLICVAPPATNSDSDDNEFHSAVSQLQSAAPEQPQETDNQHDVVNHHDEQPSHVSRRRRRRSTLTRSRRARRRRDAQGRYVYVQDGQQLVREDPFRGCVASRSVGPRHSGDFVVMGCMQV